MSNYTYLYWTPAIPTILLAVITRKKGEGQFVPEEHVHIGHKLTLRTVLKFKTLWIMSSDFCLTSDSFGRYKQKYTCTAKCCRTTRVI